MRLFFFSAELPAVPALVTHDEGGHGLVGRPGLELVVRRVLLAALSALEEGGLGALDGSQLGVVNASLDEGVALGPDLEKKRKEKKERKW